MKLVRYTDTTFDRSCFSRLLPEDYLLSVGDLYKLFDSGKYDNILKLSPIDDNMPALLYRRQISTSTAAASSTTAASTAALSTAATSTLDAEAR